ncbi:MAG: RNA polymerase sigma factor RpoE [Methylophilaceae bacterium]
MIQFDNILKLTQLNLVQPAARGYTSNTHAQKENNNASQPVGSLSLVSEQPTKLQPSVNNREVDHELVLRAQRGDKHAFGLLVDKYQRKLARLLSRMVRDQAEIEDIVQEAFIKAYRALPNFRGDSAFYTWLYRIGINTAKNYLVSSGRRPSMSNNIEIDDAENYDDGDELRTTETPESAMAAKQVAQTVNDTVASLPEELRTAITLREIEGLSYEEIATIMDCPIGTVRSRIFRARETISAKLKPLLDTPDNKRW